MWSKEEIDILMSNIERYLKVCLEHVPCSWCGHAVPARNQLCLVLPRISNEWFQLVCCRSGHYPFEIHKKILFIDRIQVLLNMTLLLILVLDIAHFKHPDVTFYMVKSHSLTMHWGLIKPSLKMVGKKCTSSRDHFPYWALNTTSRYPWCQVGDCVLH